MVIILKLSQNEYKYEFYYLALYETENTSKFGIISQRIITITGRTLFHKKSEQGNSPDQILNF